MTIDLLIPMEVPSQNVRERWHWSRQRREVKTWAKWFVFLRRNSDLDKATGKRLVKIHAFRRQRIKDEANLVGGCKGLVDGLVQAGLLVDDDRKNVTITYGQDVASKSPTRKPCTAIVIEDVPV